ncbi:YceI family protein [Dasania marina]|uniref:YceI family protein n=1 Tax=Dasania marina TaxID=471499 RepID=UPI0004B2F999|nr:YceI family protein [Dasania marina]
MMLNRLFRKSCLGLVLCCLMAVPAWAEPEQYAIDIKGQHAFVQFKIKHLGYSWLLGNFNKFDGEFNYDARQIENSSVKVVIDTTSLDSNHAERDKHLKGSDFLAVNKFPKATFTSSKVVATGKDAFDIHGELELHGVKKVIVINAKTLGQGPDPWMGYRAGFEGVTTLRLADFNMTHDLGPASTHVELQLYIEGVRKPKEQAGGSEFFE